MKRQKVYNMLEISVYPPPRWGGIYLISCFLGRLWAREYAFPRNIFHIF